MALISSIIFTTGLSRWMRRRGQRLKRLSGSSSSTLRLLSSLRPTTMSAAVSSWPMETSASIFIPASRLVHMPERTIRRLTLNLSQTKTSASLLHRSMNLARTWEDPTRTWKRLRVSKRSVSSSRRVESNNLRGRPLWIETQVSHWIKARKRRRANKSLKCSVQQLWLPRLKRISSRVALVTLIHLLGVLIPVKQKYRLRIIPVSSSVSSIAKRSIASTSTSPWTMLRVLKTARLLISTTMRSMISPYL